LAKNKISDISKDN